MVRDKSKTIISLAEGRDMRKAPNKVRLSLPQWLRLGSPQGFESKWNPCKIAHQNQQRVSEGSRTIDSG